MSDTHPDANRVHIELLRKAGPRRRAILASQLTNQVKWLSRQAIERAHPEMTEFDRAVFLVELHYGRDLAERYRAAMVARAHAPSR